ncbi:vacuolar protein sorting-associated protein 41 homolog isoform X1 [Procambarus clarkii]|uniref:vacuolar protein sorting-associated protein 41 homolog isoform X1 n=1 Tax=Procambarus clarkii TaxID=6728 RepID=UPI001E677119|nr:vacuolar protein sorting-associated protein 41 homolog [Procambarus clarkii]XP_045596775.1 vacuolar protein sorting-associated protein 41 homolog [Procambarus clarkii]XP_045596776.1 vacuolar protein sorting-associated protein 41 homolog [Procambarus clarkii]XP_045596777.1 vacuolar protein sorting-associated protein 41 homolog [Procambarus clarkii]
MEESSASLPSSQDLKDDPQDEEEVETEEGEDSEDEDSEEEEEPKLKYERISGDLREILKKDGASCISANSKLIIVGTNWGRIHVLDHQGNKVKEFSPHSNPVTMLDMDANGDYIASCSHDRKVVIQGLYTTENSHSLVMDSPVRSVALDPVYFKPRSGRRFVVGTNKVILYEKALFGQLRPTILSESSGPARAMKWAGQFLAWATDSGVRVMDMNTKTVITLIKRDHSLALPCDQYPPHLCWPDDRTLIVGWGDSVKVCRVRDRVTNPSQLAPGPVDLPPHYLEIVYMFTTDFYVCGVGPLDEHLVVLAYNKQTDLSLASLGVDSRRPQMRVLEPLQGTFEEISKDVLGIRCYQEYKPANYHLECLVEDRQFYIVCPQDVVVAKPRSADDRIEWLLEHDKHAEALEVVKTSREVQRYTLLSVGRVYLDHLMSRGSFQDAAKLCTQILGSDKALWEEAVVRFNCVRQLRVLSPHLPLGHGVNLDPAVYQMVLLDLLQTDHQGFLQVVQDWPGHLYNVSFVINAVLETLARNTNNMTLLQALAHLYSNIDKHDKALAIYLKLKHKDVFHLIARHNLYGCVAKHVVDLMVLDSSATLEICCSHVDIVPPDTVVFALSSHQQFLYKYLDALFERRRELSKRYHSQLVTLYADLDRKKLLPLLITSSSYDLRAALQVCQARCLNAETIHLLARMGNTMEALHIILVEEQDLEWAIRFCKEHDDVDLWSRLINYALDKPDCVRELLLNIGTHIDPLLIINQIPKGMEIPGLRDALVKILHDYHLQIELRTGCQRILVSDSSNLLTKLVSAQNAAHPVYGDTECAACNKRVLNPSRGELPGLVVFACRHVYHQDCIPEDSQQDVCLVCRNDKKRLFLTL